MNAARPPIDPSLDWKFVVERCQVCGCHLVTADDKVAECPHPGCDGYREPVKLKEAA